jgi:DNA replication protein DnaC
MIVETDAGHGSTLLRRGTNGYGSRSTIMTSQVPPAKWHEHLGDHNHADAICDRLLHNSHRLMLKGPSRRKESKETQTEN